MRLRVFPAAIAALLIVSVTLPRPAAAAPDLASLRLLPGFEEEFATGWLQPDGAITGRPVDLLVLGDGSMLLSDDVSGVVYRITHRSAA